MKGGQGEQVRVISVVALRTTEEMLLSLCERQHIAERLKSLGLSEPVLIERQELMFYLLKV